jgi:hypothetical protein
MLDIACPGSPFRSSESRLGPAFAGIEAAASRRAPYESGDAGILYDEREREGTGLDGAVGGASYAERNIDSLFSEGGRCDALDL